MKNQLHYYLKLIRIDNWIKNGFIFMPAFFDGKLNSYNNIKELILLFFIFSLFASSIYCFNDIIDREKDKTHPTKKLRPLANNKISLNEAISTMFTILFVAILLLFFLQTTHKIEISAYIGLYIIINILYSTLLKNIAIIDVLCIAIGFIIRLLIGSSFSSTILSHWIIIMTFLLALFLAFAKRGDDYLHFKNTGIKTRSNINRYNSQYINAVLSILSAIIIVAYLMYTLSPEIVTRYHTDKIYLTTFFVLVGILRYLQTTIVDKKSGSPTNVVLHDTFLQITISLWILSFALIIY